MAPRTLPGIGLQAYETQGEGDWNNWMDPNIRKASALIQGRVDSIVASLPGSPTDGDIHIVTTGGNAQSVAVRDNGNWVYFVPETGWLMFNTDDNLRYAFDGSSWVSELQFGNLSLFPGALVTPTVNGQVTFELTSDTTLTVKVRGSDGTVRSGTIALS